MRNKENASVLQLTIYLATVVVNLYPCVYLSSSFLVQTSGLLLQYMHLTAHLFLTIQWFWHQTRYKHLLCVAYLIYMNLWILFSMALIHWMLWSETKVCVIHVRLWLFIFSIECLLVTYVTINTGWAEQARHIHYGADLLKHSLKHSMFMLFPTREPMCQY